MLVALLLSGLAALEWRDGLVWWLGLGLVPLGLWAAVALYVASTRPLRLVRQSRVAVSTLVLAVAVTAALGIFSWPTGTVFDQVSTGGNLGRLIARAPFSWPIDGPTTFQLVLASLRAGGVALAALAVFLPRHSYAVSRVGAVVTGRLVLWTGGALAAIASRVQEWLAARAERRREREAERIAAAAQAAIDSEASLLEEPATAIVPAAAPVVATTIGEDEDADPEPAVARLLAGDHGAEADVPRASTPRPVLPAYNWKLPPLELLKAGKPASIPQAEIDATSDLIVDTLAEHGIEVKISQVTSGPTVTMYGVAPGWERSRKGARSDRWEEEEASRKRVRVDTILAREKDLALALASPNIRFESPIPGESLVGIEVPNANPSVVTLRTVMQTDAYRDFDRKAALPIALGTASSSGDVLADLTKMPHLLVAGATGSGKSVCMNTIITGLLLTRTPAQVQLVLIDPKRVELTPYAGVPHLACPPVVEADRAVLVLKAVVKEMMARYAVFESAGAKNIASFNEKSHAPLPYLVVAIDELADLMLTSANEVERTIVRLAQLGRATGVHLIVATQRPSVDVVTGLIKANFPSRIAFAVSSQVDSRTILDSNGAERLLGRGDMLFLPIDRPRPMRIQGAFLADAEVETVVRTWRASGGPKAPELQIEEPESASDGNDDRDTAGDSLFSRAQDLARQQSKLSTSLLQRRLRIGYPRAARLMDELEEAGIVGAGEPGKPRQVLARQ